MIYLFKYHHGQSNVPRRDEAYRDSGYSQDGHYETTLACVSAATLAAAALHPRALRALISRRMPPEGLARTRTTNRHRLVRLQVSCETTDVVTADDAHARRRHGNQPGSKSLLRHWPVSNWSGHRARTGTSTTQNQNRLNEASVRALCRGDSTFSFLIITKGSVSTRRTASDTEAAHYSRDSRAPPQRANEPSVTVNDPSAGSPTETLLRLLLPLNEPVWPSSQPGEAVLRQPR